MEKSKGSTVQTTLNVNVNVKVGMWNFEGNLVKIIETWDRTEYFAKSQNHYKTSSKSISFSRKREKIHFFKKVCKS